MPFGARELRLATCERRKQLHHLRRVGPLVQGREKIRGALGHAHPRTARDCPSGTNVRLQCRAAMRQDTRFHFLEVAVQSIRLCAGAGKRLGEVSKGHLSAARCRLPGLTHGVDRRRRNCRWIFRPVTRCIHRLWRRHPPAEVDQLQFAYRAVSADRFDPSRSWVHFARLTRSLPGTKSMPSNRCSGCSNYGQQRDQAKVAINRGKQADFDLDALVD